jgi:hypothetical protein
MVYSIRDDIAAIYRASGYAVTAGDRLAGLVASRVNEHQIGETVVLALPLEATELPDNDRVRTAILAHIGEFGPDGVHRIYVVALPALTSLGSEFQSQVKQAGAEIRHYAGILDGGYGGDYIGLGSTRREIARSLRETLFNYSRVDADQLAAVVRTQYAKKALALAPTRVHQRYYIRDGLAVGDRRETVGADLLHHFVARLGQPASQAEVFLVIGPGGAGKSFLFEGLFTYLYEAFQRNKQKQEVGIRPIPFMPDSLIAQGARHYDDLFAAVAATEFGEQGGEGLLDHLAQRGRSILMFDGLDEFFADNHDLGVAISERYLMPGSQARIFIFLRDSLLATSDKVRGAAERLAAELGPERLSVFELAPWDAAYAQRELAWLKFERRRPQFGEADTEMVAGFLSWLRRSPRLGELASIAFYCDLLADLYPQMLSGDSIEARSGRLMPEDEYDLLGLCFDLILDRELGKQRPDPEQVPEYAFLPATIHDAFATMFAAGASGGDPRLAWGRQGLVELIEEAAYLARRLPGGDRLDAPALHRLYADLDLGDTPEDRTLGERMLRQLVLFVQGSQPDTVDFTHEFMADYLAARYVVERMRRDHEPIEALRGTAKHGETDIFNGYIARELLRA